MSVVIAARDEAAYIGACLDAVLAQDAAAGNVEIIVAANACKDMTVAEAQARAPRAAERGWRIVVLDLTEGGKTLALNAGDRVARGAMRVYLDADVICGADLFGQLRVVLARPEPVYATGALQVAWAASWVTRQYAAVWVRLPFVRSGAVGAGLFAVNGAGRARWDRFPAIISDDTFVRLQFSPAERVEVDASYQWPMVEGLRALIRVRRRQDAGVAQVHLLYPQLRNNEGKRPFGVMELFGLCLSAPIGFLVYAFVHVVVRLGPQSGVWSRGR